MIGVIIKLFVAIIFLIIISFAEIFSQSSEVDYDKLSQRYNITHEEDVILKLQDKITGKTIIKTKNIKSIPADYDFDLIIDLRTIDTTQYFKLFTLWSEIPLYYHWRLPLIIADANNDGRKDVYGTYKSYDSDYYRAIYEINSNGSYDSIYKYPDTLGRPWDIGDLENDGYLETINGYTYYYSSGYNHYIKALTIDSITGYPTQLKVIYDPTTGNGQPVDMTLYDMDGDGYPEMIYRLDGSGDSLVLSNSFQIAKYDRFNNEFNLVYQNRPSIYSIYTRGFAFGDFDSDGKKNFAVSNQYGEVFIYEYADGNNYNVIRIDSLPIRNVYLQLFTNDLDHNSKPELWICGDGYINGVGSQILYIYEADGNDQYSIVYSIAVIGGSTWFAMNMLAADIDNDRTEEVLLCVDQHLLVLKNKSSDYELYYIKRNELLNQNSTYTSATVADFDGDIYPEIVISMDLVENNALRGFSRIYKKTSTLDILDNNPILNNYYLSEAYPNPFNTTTTISYTLPYQSSVELTIYDIMGREVKAFNITSQPSGYQNIVWDGTNDDGVSVSSGVYLYRINIKSLENQKVFVKTSKLMLLK